MRGARQVGKTWLMREFGRTHYEQVAYFNFDSNARMQRLFEGDFNIDRLISGLAIEAGMPIDAPKTLIIFDEIQETPKALSSLKYFYENAPEYQIIAAGSLLGVALHQGTSFPVGKVDFLDLYPLNFAEFLKALEKTELLKLLEKKDWPLITTFKDQYIDLLKRYYFVGGMPEAVATFIKGQDFSEARNIQKKILLAYDQDFSKHVPPAIVPKLRMLWNSIPAQLSKENRKFVYGLVRHGARAREYELALAWLCDYGVATRISRVTKPSLPLKAYEDMSSFKLFQIDVGLLGAQSGLDIQTILDGSDIFEEFKGALTEQYVFGELRNKKDLSVYYWSADRGSAEIDFMIQHHGKVIPVEVKASENLQAKSLKAFRQKYEPEISIRTSMSDHREEGWLTNIPLYALGVI
jgi:hypothetical protein